MNLGLFISAIIFTGSECFWLILHVGNIDNTVILTGLIHTSSPKGFPNIMVDCGTIISQEN